nr:hypothetical protein BEI47_18580 [Aliivibrio fischeri]
MTHLSSCQYLRNLKVVEDQINTLKEITGTQKDSELVKALGISKGVVSTWRGRGKVPDSVMEKAQKGKFNVSKITIPLYDVIASAGVGVLVEYEPSVEVELGDTLKIALGINHPSKAKMLHVQGDSMSPTLQSNSLIAIEEVDSFSDDGIYVFTWDNDLFVKRLQRTKAGIKVISDNTVYEPWEILSDEMRGEGFIIRGRVTGCCQHL